MIFEVVKVYGSVYLYMPVHRHIQVYACICLVWLLASLLSKVLFPTYVQEKSMLLAKI